MVALLGVVNLIAGFLPEVSLPDSGRLVVQSVSVFAVGPGWVPLLLLIGGLLAAAAFLPGGGDHRFAAAAVSVGGAVGGVVALGVPNGFEQLLGASLGNGAGALLLFIGGTIQAVVAIAALVLATPQPGAGVFSGGPAGMGGPSAGSAPMSPAPVGPWPAGPFPSGGGTPVAGGAVPPRIGGPADLRDTGPIGPAAPSRPDSAGSRPDQPWTRPTDATVNIRAEDRPSTGAAPDGR